jgi:hypothetical protein
VADAPRPRVYVEAPEGWAPARAVQAELERLGYRVEEWRFIGTGTTWLVIK